MKRLLSLLILGILLSSVSDAQLWKMRRFEATAAVGTTQFFGDIGGYSKGDNLLGLKDISLRHTRLALDGALKYRVLNDVSARLSLSVGSFHSTDKKGDNIDRGFESRTLFFEPALIGEYYFIKNKGDNSFLLMKGSSYPFPKRFFPMLDCYMFTGIGGLAYSVKPNDLLKPLMTGKSGFTPVIPFGLGASLAYSGTYNIGVELGARYTFSDNIDGYTSRYSESKDFYYILNFTFTYKIRTRENGIPMGLAHRGGR